MSKDVRLQAIRVAVVLALLLALIAWQHKFVFEGIEANPYLNLIIIAVFIFAASHACISLAKLNNEENAFRALKEVYQDVLAGRRDLDADSSSRLARCRVPGIVYRSPKLLGHVYDLTLEELLRTRHMRISLSTMQNLVHAIEQRIAVDRSLLVYITGLSVFLGLIGTFIGLMDMVGSVGGIIGSLAKSDAGDANAMKGLIRDLEGPLVGMATGFSSSLFGLFGSLVLGLIGRFVTQASMSVKDEFEGWLAGISQIENEGGQQAGIVVQQAAPVDPGLVSQLHRTGDTLERVTVALRQLADRHAESASALVRATAQNEAVALQFIEVTRSLERMDHLGEELSRHQASMRDTEGRILGAIEAGAARSEAASSGRHSESLAAIVKVATRQESLAAGAAVQGAAILEAAGAIRQAQETAREETRAGWNAMHSEASRLAASLAATVTRAEELARQAVERVEPRLAAMEGRSDEIGAATARIHAAVDLLLRSAGLQAATSGEQAALVRQIADGQAESREMLRMLADTARQQPQSLALAIGTGLAAVAKSVEDLERAARRNADASAASLSAEVRQSARSVEDEIAAGFADLARSFETTFVSYAELLREVKRQGATDAAGTEGATAASAV